MTPPMFVSVVIATRNRSALLGQTLDAVARQRWPHDRLEIVVADNGSTDDTRLVVEQATAVRFGTSWGVRAGSMERLGGRGTDVGTPAVARRAGGAYYFFRPLWRGGARGVCEPAALARPGVPADRLYRAYFRRWLYQNG